MDYKYYSCSMILCTRSFFLSVNNCNQKSHIYQQILFIYIKFDQNYHNPPLNTSTL